MASGHTGNVAASSKKRGKDADSDAGAARALQDARKAELDTAWPDLPEAIKAGILAMVRASKPAK